MLIFQLELIDNMGSQLKLVLIKVQRSLMQTIWFPIAVNFPI